MWSVQTYGGQILGGCEPKPVDFHCEDDEQRRRLYDDAKRGLIWDCGCNYYATKEDARRAIDWAMMN